MNILTVKPLFNPRISKMETLPTKMIHIVYSSLLKVGTFYPFPWEGELWPLTLVNISGDAVLRMSLLCKLRARTFDLYLLLQTKDTVC